MRYVPGLVEIEEAARKGRLYNSEEGVQDFLRESF